MEEKKGKKGIKYMWIKKIQLLAFFSFYYEFQ